MTFPVDTVTISHMGFGGLSDTLTHMAGAITEQKYKKEIR